MSSTSVKIEIKEKRIVTKTPYNTEFLSGAKHLKGKWDAENRVWSFDIRDEQRVRELLADVFGYETEEGGKLVSFEMTINEQFYENPGSYVDDFTIAGRTFAQRLSRDSAVKTPSWCLIKDGDFGWSGGSVKYPEIFGKFATESVTLEFRDLPESMWKWAQKNITNCEIRILDEIVDKDALKKEKEALLGRLAEIESLLAD